MCLSDKPKRPSDSQARRDSYADCVLCRRIFKNLDRKIFEKCHDIKVDLNFQGGLLYTAAYVRWDFFIGIISLRFAEDLLRTEGSIGAKRHSIPLCHPISLSLSPQYLGDQCLSSTLHQRSCCCPLIFFGKRQILHSECSTVKSKQYWPLPLQVLLGSKVTTARSFAWMFPKGHYTLLCYFFSKAQCGVRISRQM